MSAKTKATADSKLNSQLTDNKTAIWLEWSDAELNNEKWAIPKNGPDGLFLDIESVSMPPSLEPHAWIRAKDLNNLTEPLTLNTSDTPDLLANNGHIMHSEFVRWFISTVMSLEQCGRNGLEISGENANFIWNGRSQPWHVSMNLYSMNKAGKASQHRPLVNPNGKYIARLYFMGCWRRIVIDDMIPVDKEGTPLLPRSENNSELWPMLISKACLKLCSLSYNPPREVVDLQLVACLTGWVCLSLSIGHLSPQDKWDLVTKYTERFEWRTDPDSEDQGSPRVQINEEGKRSNERLRKFGVPDKPQPVSLFMSLKDTGDLDPEAVPGLSPARSHLIYVAQHRDVPLDPKDVKPPLARWKLHRWLDWAIDQGLINPAEYFSPLRCLKIVSPFAEHRLTSDMDEKHQSDSNSTQRTKSKQSLTADASLWCDFNKLHPHIKDILLFYKLEYFPYTVRISDSLALTRDYNSKKPESKKESKKGSKKSTLSEATSVRESEFLDSYIWPREMLKTRNEPLYLFCDSSEEKFFLITFSASQVDLSAAVNLKIQSRKENYLIVERHSWFDTPKESPTLLIIRTIGTKSSVVQLRPGRHLLRVYRRSEFDSFITISSDTIFHVGDRAKIQKLMCTESDRIDMIARNISRCIARAYRAFGSESYSESLKAYYKSYMPEDQGVKTRRDRSFCKQIHDFFLEEKARLVRESFSTDDAESILRSLRVFFLNPDIGLGRFDRISVMLRTLKQLEASASRSVLTKLDFKERDFPKTSSKTLRRFFNQEQAARIIEAFFKMVTVKKYKEIHNPGHREHNSVREDLLKLAELFDREGRESPARRLLRNVVKRDERLNEFYPCAADFEHVLQVQECRGTLTDIKPDQWLAIARFTVNPRDAGTVQAGIDLFVNLPRYDLRVFSNETRREMFRVAGKVLPARYQQTKTGYTIFAYGWNGGQRFRELEWTMNIITMRGEPMFHLPGDQEPLSSKTILPALQVQEYPGAYLPNRKNYISKWILRPARRSPVSFRLRTSYDPVEIRLRILDADGKVLGQAEGKSAVVLPVVFLGEDEPPARKSLKNLMNGDAGEAEGNDAADPTERSVCYLEAFVLNDSWPLTEAEWNVVRETKAKREHSAKSKLPSVANGRPSKSDLSRGKKLPKQPVDGVQLPEPYSILQVVTDAGTNLQVSEDRRKEKELAAMKEEWRRENPESLQRGEELREAFINKHRIPAPVQSETDPARTASTASLERTEPRYLKPIPSADYRLPSIDLSEFIEDSGTARSEVETDCEFEDEEQVNPVELEIVNARRDYEDFLRTMQTQLDSRRLMYQRIFTDYKNSFWENRNQLNNIYEARRMFVAAMKPADAAAKPEKKGRKVKRTP